MTKCLAQRVKSVINDIVFVDQYAYIAGRKVAAALRIVDDVTKQCNLSNKTGILFATDFTAAFDSIISLKNLSLQHLKSLVSVKTSRNGLK